MINHCDKKKLLLEITRTAIYRAYANLSRYGFKISSIKGHEYLLATSNTLLPSCCNIRKTVHKLERFFLTAFRSSMLAPWFSSDRTISSLPTFTASIKHVNPNFQTSQSKPVNPQSNNLPDLLHLDSHQQIKGLKHSQMTTCEWHRRVGRSETVIEQY